MTRYKLTIEYDGTLFVGWQRQDIGISIQSCLEDAILKLSKEKKEIRVVNNEILTPTNTVDLAKQIVKLSLTSNYGLYHATSQGQCSWYEFAKKIFHLTDTKVKLSIADPVEFKAKTKRPTYSVLENFRLQSLNLDFMPHWEDSLKN